MKKKIKGFFKSLDFFSVDIGFNINEKKAYGTLLGGIVFIMYIIVTCYFVITNFISFVDRSIFNQNTLENTLDYAPKLNLLDSKIVYAFGVTIDGIVNMSYSNFINYKLHYVSYFKNNNTRVKTPLHLVKCTKEHFGNLLNEEYDLLSIDDYHCIDKDKYEELVIQGIYTEDVFQFLEFTAITGPEAEIQILDFQNFLSHHKVQLQLYYMDSLIDVGNYTSPSRLYFNSKYIQLSYPFLFMTNAYFTNSTFENDACILLDKSTISNFYTVSNIETMNTFPGFTRMDDKLADYDVFAKIYIRSSQSEVTVRRVYQKFDEFLADSTSIVSELLFILMILLNAYNKFRGTESIIDRIMRYKQKLVKKSPNEYKILRKLFNNQMINTEEEVTNREVCQEVEIINLNDLNTKKSPKTLAETNSNLQRISRKKSQRTQQRNYGAAVVDTRNNFIVQIDSIPQNIQNYVKGPPIYTVFLPDKLDQCKVKTTKNQFDEQTSMKFNFSDFVKYFLSKIGIKSNIKYKTEMLKKGKDYYMFNLDIFTYFTKMREIDLIKYFIFNKDESNLIDFLSKPSISYLYSNMDSPISNSTNKFSMTNENIENVSDSFRAMYNEYKNTNNTDKKTEKLLQQTSYEIYQLIHE